MRRAITCKEWKFCDYIKDCIKSKYSPSLKEIMRELRLISTESVDYCSRTPENGTDRKACKVNGSASLPYGGEIS